MCGAAWSIFPIIEMFNSNSHCWGKSVLLQVFQHADRCGRDIFSVFESRGKRYMLYLVCASCKGDQFQECCDTFSRHGSVSCALMTCLGFWHYYLLRYGKRIKRQLINVSEKAKEFGKKRCKILLEVYVFTREDCVSTFKVKGCHYF